MTPEDILSHPARVLSDGQRRRYFETGFLAAPGLIGGAWLDRLNALSRQFVEDSRAVAASMAKAAHSSLRSSRSVVPSGSTTCLKTPLNPTTTASSAAAAAAAAAAHVPSSSSS